MESVGSNVSQFKPGEDVFGGAFAVKYPEISGAMVYDKVDKTRGMDITIVTSARTDEEGLELLRAMGMPFKAQ